MRISILRLVFLGLFALVMVSVVSAFAAGISVPTSNVGQRSVLVTAEDVKPAACDAQHLTNIVSGSGNLTGTAGNDLILGSSGADIIDGLDGDDCILGSGGDDSLIGNAGNDVCFGGTESDIFTDCETEIQ
jgi:Ca2+-binding RTX toxin-like protein